MTPVESTSGPPATAASESCHANGSVPSQVQSTSPPPGALATGALANYVTVMNAITGVPITPY